MKSDQSVSTGWTDDSLDTPAPPGAFFLSVIPGLVGRGVSAAQAFARGGCLWTHAGLYLGNGSIIQAEPGGVRLRQLPDRLAQDPILWSDAPIQTALTEAYRALSGDLAILELENLYRGRVVEAAITLVDSPYAWLDIVTIAAAEWRIPGWEKLRAHTNTSGRYLCSSFVDHAYDMAGIHLFTDKRPPGQVTPADLARYDEAWVRSRLATLEARVGEIEDKLP